MKASALSLGSKRGLAPSLRASASARRPAPRALAVAPRANAVGDVARYLSEAASQIFYPTRNNVPWERSAEPFTGAIIHHEQVPRLHALLREVSTARKDLESKLEDKPTDAEVDELTASEDSQLGEFVTTSIERVMGHNFKGDETEPAWRSAGYKDSWKSQRDIRREYARLSRFERVVKKTLEKAETKV
eukprot:scaffold9.g3008.t1